MNPVAVIPARYGSNRLPGKPIIHRVYERVEDAGIFSRILVATDSEAIARRVEAMITSHLA